MSQYTDNIHIYVTHGSNTMVTVDKTSTKV